MTEKTRIQMLRDLHDRSTKLLISLAAVWLALFSILLPHQGEDSMEKFSYLSIQIIFAIILSFWAVFFVDFILYIVACRGERRFWKKINRAFWASLAPPFRLMVPTFAEPGKIWIPCLGWHEKDRKLEKKLSEAFSLPMILVVLMVLPILGVEYLKKEWLEYQGVRWALGVGSLIIWLAFTIEFTVMISVARRKVAYCFRHWIDLAIILLPVILFILPFLSFLPIVRLARLSRVMRSTRVLRLKGVGIKAFQALVLLSGSKRFGKGMQARRLKKLKDQLEDMEEEMKEMKKEIAELEGEEC